MKITRETLKQMIAEEVAKLDPQNEGFMDAVKGTGKYLGSKVGIKTDKPGMDFAEEIESTLSQATSLDFIPGQFVGKNVTRDASARKKVEQAAKQIYNSLDGSKKEYLVQAARQVQSELQKWKNSSESAQQAKSFGNGSFSPNDRAENTLAAANLFSMRVIDAHDYDELEEPLEEGKTQQHDSNDESPLSTSLNNLKKVVAEEIVKIELEKMGK
jgi:hypothetical protein